MKKFDDLKAEHQRLLAEHDAGAEDAALLVSAQSYIERIRIEAEQVSDPRDRDQLRSYLRFWGAYVYDRTGTYPETSLRPALQLEPPRKIKWDWRWALGGALILLIVLVVFSLSGPVIGNVFTNITASLGQSATPTIRSTAEELEPIEATQTATILPPSDTPLSTTSTPSPTPVLAPTDTPGGVAPTPDPRTATVAALFTQAADAATREASEIITAIPTSDVEAQLPETGGGGYLGLIMDAEVSGGNGWDWCTSRFLEVSVVDRELVSDENTPLTLWIDPAGQQRFLRQEISVNQPGLLIDLGNLSGTETYALLHLEHPQLPSKDLIFRFSPNCRAERLQVSFRVADEWLSLEEEQPRDQNLSVEWRLVTWGPEPLAGNRGGRWLATLDLMGQGGDGTYIYWKSNQYGYLEISESSQVLIRGWACAPGSIVVGVTSAGLALAREIVLQAPYCPEATPTPAP